MIAHQGVVCSTKPEPEELLLGSIRKLLCIRPNEWQSRLFLWNPLRQILGSLRINHILCFIPNPTFFLLSEWTIFEVLVHTSPFFGGGGVGCGRDLRNILCKRKNRFPSRFLKKMNFSTNFLCNINFINFCTCTQTDLIYHVLCVQRLINLLKAHAFIFLSYLLLHLFLSHLYDSSMYHAKKTAGLHCKLLWSACLPFSRK